MMVKKTFTIVRSPEVLCIHIKRFRYDSYFSSKISDHVEFPIEDFDLSPYFTGDFDFCLYDLFAIINHRGGLGGGHYVTYAKNWKNLSWYEFDDRTVTEVSRDFLQNIEAYVLFYQKKIPDKRKKEIRELKRRIKYHVLIPFFFVD